MEIFKLIPAVIFAGEIGAILFSRHSKDATTDFMSKTLDAMLHLLAFDLLELNFFLLNI